MRTVQPLIILFATLLLLLLLLLCFLYDYIVTYDKMIMIY